MNTRVTVAATGAGATAFLVVAVAVVELLPVEFSALVGLPAGVLAGGAVLVLIGTRYDRLRGASRYAVDAAAGFGVAVFVVQAVRYVNLAGLRSALTLESTAGVAVLAAVLAALVSWWWSRR
jgi:hypothetical protein